jgi:hypothetical protein
MPWSFLSPGDGQGSWPQKDGRRAVVKKTGVRMPGSAISLVGRLEVYHVERHLLYAMAL